MSTNKESSWSNAISWRHLGHYEFRIAAARMFEKLEMHAQAVAVLLLEVDKYLTPEEIADRERIS